MEAIPNQRGPEVTLLLIDKGADVNAKNKWGMTPLIYAARSVHITVYKKLLEKGANHLCLDYAGCNALYYLIEGHGFSTYYGVKPNAKELIEVLPHDKASLAVVDSETGNSILHHAAANGYLKLVKKLLKNDVDINKQNNEGETPIIIACKRKQYLVFEFLLKHNADITIKDNNNDTVITIAQQYANQSGDNTLEDILIKYNIELPLKLGELDVNQVDKKGNTALHLATKDCTFGTLEKMQELIERGADINLQNKQGKTALMLASWLKKRKLLIENGANVNLQDNYGKTALIYLMDDNYYGDDDKSSFDLLMSVENIDVNLQTKVGMTALMYVCKVTWDVSYYIKALINKGAKVDLTTTKGKTAVSFVRQYDYEKQDLLKIYEDS